MRIRDSYSIRQISKDLDTLAWSYTPFCFRARWEHVFQAILDFGETAYCWKLFCFLMDYELHLKLQFRLGLSVTFFLF